MRKKKEKGKMPVARLTYRLDNNNNIIQYLADEYETKKMCCE